MQGVASRNMGRIGMRIVFDAGLLALLSGMAACSGDTTGPGGVQDASSGTDSSPDALLPGTDAPDGTTGAETGAEASPDAESDACSSQSVWPQNAAGFTYERSGGFVAPPPADAGCNGADTIYQFSVGSRILTKLDCSFSGRSANTVHLSDGAAAQIVTSLQALVTSCPENRCGADAPDIALTVQPASGSPIVYNSDFYSGCQGQIVRPPYISFGSLTGLEGVLNGIVTSACRPDGGADAGSCSPGLPDGG